MTTGRPDAREIGRWVLAAGFGLVLHAGFALALVSSEAMDDDGGPAGAFVVELAPLPVARAEIPESVAPGPDQVEAAAAPAAEPAPEPEKAVAEPPRLADPIPDLPPLPPLPVEQAEAVLPPPTPPDPPVAPKAPQTPQAPAPTTSATQAISEVTGEKALAPQVAPPSRVVSTSIPTWQTKLTTVLERSKRYPASAQARREQGVVQVRFVIDREGRLLSRQVVKTSGHDLLDAEAIALLDRAQPFPAPPSELKGPHVALAVPIRFFLH